jgi:hypothetical protein
MRREGHRRRGVFRASSGGWGHRAVYVGAAVATAALLAGFGVAILVYGPLGTPARQLAGSTLNVPPKGVSFGNASVAFASSLNLTNSTGVGWHWAYNATGAFNGPCNSSGILAPNGSYVYANNESSPVNLTGNTTLVCLNSVNNGLLNATWYYSANGTQLTFNNYTAVGSVANGSYYNSSFANVSSCSNWTLFHELQNSSSVYNGSYIPCDTYFEMNNNTNWLPSYSGNNSTLWSPNQTGYAPNDLVYAVPVDFTNNATGGVYAISVSIEGITPVAQTFYFNATGANDTVLFTFDMTSAWLMDLTLENATTPFNASAMPIYASIGVVSALVTECGQSGGVAVCPVATKT